MGATTTRQQAVHRDAVSMDIAGVAAFLQETLGRRLTAHIAQIDPKAVGEWAQGGRKPRSATEQRLRHTYHVFQTLQERESPHTVRAWFVGMNPELDDESPAEVLRDGRYKDVLAAAKKFISG